MDRTSWEIFGAIGGLFLSCCIALVTATWALRGSGELAIRRVDERERAITNEREEFRRGLEKRFRDVDAKLVAGLRDVDEKLDAAQHAFGEAVNAAKQKISDMELWNRDHLVSIRVFDRTVSDLKSSLAQFEQKLDDRLRQGNELTSLIAQQLSAIREELQQLDRGKV